jgi:hypothetical protein
MAHGTVLDMSEMPPVSPELLAATDTIQDAWIAWNPELQRVEVIATAGGPAVPVSSRHGTFFSGGVDAVHAALDGGAPGEILVYLDGFDHALGDLELAELMERMEPLAKALNGELLSFRTNWTIWRRDIHLSRLLLFGSVLAAAANLLGVRRMTIAASADWGDLFPTGSHIMTDPLWSTGKTEIRHWGCHRSRIEKLARIIQRPELLEGLQVCHAGAGNNCGECSKCIRTRVMLRLLGAELPNLGRHAVEEPMAMFARIMKHGQEGHYVSECLAAARSAGDEESARILARGIASVERRRVLRDISRRLLPGRSANRERTADLKPWGYGPDPR